MSHSRLLGKNFYKLDYRLLLFSLPLLIILLVAMLWYKNNNDIFIARAKNQLPETHNEKMNFHQYLLVIEHTIYLIIYFLTDTIASFELINLLLVSAINHALFPVKTFAFILSITYALWIHVYCRSDDMQKQYVDLHIIAENLTYNASLEPISIPVVTYSLLLFALYFSSNIMLFTLSICLAISISLTYYKQILSMHYGIYLHMFAYTKMRKFSTLLVKQLRIFNLHSSPPRILSYTNYLFNTLAFLYALVYCSSTIRTEQITSMVAKPPGAHDNDIPYAPTNTSYNSEDKSNTY